MKNDSNFSKISSIKMSELDVLKKRELLIAKRLEELSIELINVKDIKTLVILNNDSEGILKLCQKYHYSNELLIKVSIFRAHSQRKIGKSLLEKPIHGGDRSASSTNTGLKTIGITQNQSSEFQKIAKLPEEIFNKYLEDEKSKNKAVTLAGLLKLSKIFLRNEQSEKISNVNLDLTIIKKFENEVLLGDVLERVKEIPDKSVDCCIADPDYNVNLNYANNQNYTKTWDEYIEWYSHVIQECLRITKDDGNIFLINYPKQNAHLRVNFLDKVIPQLCVHEYVWVYEPNIGYSNNHFTSGHRSVLHITKSKQNTFYKNQVCIPFKNPNDRRTKLSMSVGSEGRMPNSWFEFPQVKNVSKGNTQIVKGNNRY
jgi:hypothetical protein